MRTHSYGHVSLLLDGPASPLPRRYQKNTYSRGTPWPSGLNESSFTPAFFFPVLFMRRLRECAIGDIIRALDGRADNSVAWSRRTQKLTVQGQGALCALCSNVGYLSQKVGRWVPYAAYPHGASTARSGHQAIANAHSSRPDEGTVLSLGHLSISPTGRQFGCRM